MATFHVSSTGNDANSGSISAPWLHHPWDSAATGVSAAKVLAAGDEVLYRRGETHITSTVTVDEGGADGNLIWTADYGSGDKPIVTNPASYVFLNSGATDNYCGYENLDIRGAFGTGAVIVDNCTGVQFKSCRIENAASGYAVGFSGNNCALEDSEIIVNAAVRAMHCSGAYSGSIIRRNKINILASILASDSTCAGIYLSGGVSGYEIYDNEIGSDTLSFLYGVRIDAATACQILRNIIKGVELLGQGIGGVSATMAQFLIQRNIITKFLTGININNGGGRNDIVQNIVSGYGVNGIDLVVEADNVTPSKIHNNLVIHSPHDAVVRGHGIEIEDGVVSLKNNIVVIPSAFAAPSGIDAAGVHCIAYTAGYTEIDASNNCYYVHPDALTIGANLGKHLGGIANSLSEFSALIADDALVTTKENNSADVNPLIDANYRLTKGSPCIRAGVDVGLTVDADGVTIPTGAGFDIGPYFYKPEVDEGFSPWVKQGTMPALTLSDTAPGDLRSVQEWKKVASAREIEWR